MADGNNTIKSNTWTILTWHIFCSACCLILDVGWRWCFGRMDVPAVNTSFAHPQPQSWGGQNHMTSAMSPASWKPNPTCPPPSYHYTYTNPTHQNKEVSLAPMTHTPVICPGARPQTLYWDTSQQSYQGKNRLLCWTYRIVWFHITLSKM